MRVCVIGASGFMGRSLLARLVEIPAIQITAVDLLPAVMEHPSIRWFQGDLQDPAAIAEFLPGQEVVFHLAHINTPITSDQDMLQDALLNLVPTLRLLKAAEIAGTVPHFVYPSSGGAVYGVSASRDLFKEDDPCQPASSYGIQKLMAEHYLRLASEHRIVTATVLRIANAYGWLLPPDRPQGFIGTAVSRVKAGQPVRLFGNPDNVRDYVHIDDIVEALLRAARRPGSYELYNIGTGIGTSVTGILAIIERITGQPVERVCEDVRFSEFLNNWCVLDVQKAQRELGWQSTVGLEDGIRRLLTSPA